MHRHRSTLLLSALALAACASLALAQDGTPKAVPVEPIKDFEIVPKGQLLEHTFLIRNDGDTTLEVTEVRPACGCTVADFDNTIAPGATGKVSVKVKTESFAGPISKSVSVFTNDSQNPKLQLVVKADIKPYVTIVPGFVRYNFVQGEEVGKAFQTLWSEDGSDVAVTAVKAPYDYLSVEFHEATEEERNPKGPGRQWVIDVALSPNAPVGALRDFVTVELDHPKQKFAKIPVSGFVRPRQHITPDKADFGNLEGETLPLKRTFHFTNFITDGIELTEIDTGLVGLGAEVVPSENQPGHRFRLVLTLDESMPKGAFDTVVRIHTSDNKNPVIELPVRGSIL